MNVDWRKAIYVLISVVAVLCTTACSYRSARRVDSIRPDRVLFDKATVAVQEQRFSVANLTLQTLVNTYPHSKYAEQAKLMLQDPRVLDAEEGSQPLLRIYATRRHISSPTPERIPAQTPAIFQNGSGYSSHTNFGAATIASATAGNSVPKTTAQVAVCQESELLLRVSALALLAGQTNASAPTWA